SSPWLGTSVSEPNAAEETKAGFTLSPQVARSMTEKPARIEFGETTRMVAALAGDAANGTQAASSVDATTASASRTSGRRPPPPGGPAAGLGKLTGRGSIRYMAPPSAGRRPSRRRTHLRILLAAFAHLQGEMAMVRLAGPDPRETVRTP